MSEDMDGYMRPCEHCNGTGTGQNWMGLKVLCDFCNGTGIYKMKMLVDEPTADASAQPAATDEKGLPHNVAAELNSFDSMASDSKATVETRKYIERLTAELATERARAGKLAAALAEIERNAPIDEPINTGVTSRNYAIAWAFWSAGQTIRNVLAAKAEGK